ncbi:MAG: hypothetical protein AAGA62_07710, partial [Bacteroidota bacterium]
QLNTATSSLFVYGREVDDFHTVDYEAISMLNVSATQEQQRRIEHLADSYQRLERDQAQIDRQVKKIAQRLSSLETKLSDKPAKAAH